MVSATRRVQTKIKHIILKEYLDAWTGIILHGIRNHKTKGITPKVKFIYVDLFSCTGKYDDDTTEPIDTTSGSIKGSPLIGIESLRKSVSFGHRYEIDVSYNCIFIENDKDNYCKLKETLKNEQLLERGRILETNDFTKLKNQDIAIINDDCLKHKENVLKYINSKQTWSFIFIDPYGAKSIPMSMVSDYVNAAKVDCIINFPVLDVYRKAGNIDKKTDRNSGQEQTLLNIDYTYGNSDWRQINYLLSQSNIANKTNDIEDMIGQMYYRSLLAKCSNAIIKQNPINFPDRNRRMYDLFLTTKDADGAIAMNTILRKANVNQPFHAKLAQIRKAEQKLKENKQLSAFSADEIIKSPENINKPNPISFSKEEVSDWLYTKLVNSQLSLKDIYKTCANKSFTRTEIHRGLRLLKDDNKVIFTNLNKGYNIVEFLK